MKYGQHIWIVYEGKGEVCVYDDVIEWISVDKDGLNYGLKEACIDVKEDDIILYDEMDKLSIRIKEVMQEIREKEGEEK